MTRLLDAASIAKLGGLHVRARAIVEGFVAGLHRSPYKGFSVEFAEHRPYIPGDPLKNVDWKVYAKSDRYYVKEYEEETNLRAHLVLDASASMGYGSDGRTKLEYGRTLCAALAYLMLRQQDSVGLLLFDREIRKMVPPRSTGRHLHVLLQELEQVVPSAETALATTLHRLADRVSRRGLIILVSDLFEDPEAVLRGLRHFRHERHEVVVFHVLDIAEREFDFSREAIFRDLETSRELLVQPWEIRDEYRKSIAAWIEQLRFRCREMGVDYVSMNTETPYDDALLAYLDKRRRLG